MLAELTLLLHEMLEPAVNRGSPASDLTRDGIAAGGAAIVVTGLPSPGKARLVEALRDRLQVDGIAVEASRVVNDRRQRIYVHAESDLEALVEGSRLVGHASREADVVVPVDWEAPARSVARVVELLVARGLVAPEV
jgi:hypothetical protein